jgi:hypothetical protein
MYPFAVGPPVRPGGGAWGEEDIPGGAGGAWGDPELPGGAGASWEQLAAAPPAQRSALMRLLGGIGDAMSMPRRMMWEALGLPDSGAQLSANIFGGDAEGMGNRAAGFLAEAVLDPISLGLGAGGGLARLAGRAANAGGAGRLGGLIANDARAIDMTNDARAMGASLGRPSLPPSPPLGGASPGGTLLSGGPQSSLAQALDLPALPPPPKAVISPAAIDEMQAASMAGYDPRMVNALPGVGQMPAAGPGMVDAGLGAAGAGARQYKMVDPSLEAALTDYGWMSGMQRTGPGRVGGTLNYGPGQLPDFAQMRMGAGGMGVRPTGAPLPPDLPADYAGMLMGQANTPLVGQLTPAQQRQIMLQRIAQLSQG